MKRNHWIAVGLALTVAAGAQAAARSSVDAPRTLSYDIITQNYIPANETCGHYATNNGNFAWGLDWAVNGSVVAEDADSGINYTNDGSPYTVSIGEVSGGSFTAYYSETFYPQAYTGSGPSPQCLQI
jgi:hypothetical protein